MTEADNLTARLRRAAQHVGNRRCPMCDRPMYGNPIFKQPRACSTTCVARLHAGIARATPRDVPAEITPPRIEDMTTHADNSRAALMRTEETTRTEIANLSCRLVAAKNKLASLHRTLDARAPGWREQAKALVVA